MLPCSCPCPGPTSGTLTSTAHHLLGLILITRSPSPPERGQAIICSAPLRTPSSTCLARMLNKWSLRFSQVLVGRLSPCGPHPESLFPVTRSRIQAADHGLLTWLLDQQERSQQMTPSGARHLGLAPWGLSASRGWTIWCWDESWHPRPPAPHLSPGSGMREGLAFSIWGRLGFCSGDVACRVLDWPWFSLQRKASTMSVSCATRCSTPRPSSSVTSSSTASRAWAAPSNAPCASQVSVPRRGAHGKREGTPGPGPQHLLLAPGFVGEAPRDPQPRCPACLHVELTPGPLRLHPLASPLRQLGSPALRPALHSTAARPFPTQPFLSYCGPITVRWSCCCELWSDPRGPLPSSLARPSPGSMHAPSMLPAGGVKGSFAGQVPSPQTGCWPRQAAVPARGESQGLCWPPSCCPDGSRCAWGLLAFSRLPLTSVVCRGGKPTLGRAPGRRGSLL